MNEQPNTEQTQSEWDAIAKEWPEEDLREWEVEDLSEWPEVDWSEWPED